MSAAVIPIERGKLNQKWSRQELASGACSCLRSILEVVRRDIQSGAIGPEGVTRIRRQLEIESKILANFEGPGGNGAACRVSE